MIALRTQLVRILLQAHRWLGLAIGLVVMVWFASGIAMIYVGGMPALAPQERLDRLPALDVASIRIAPAQAAKLAVVAPEGEAPLLTTVTGRPAYRFASSGATVFADDGTVLEPVSEARAAAVAQQFLPTPAPRLRLRGRLDHPDQWTLSLRRSLPILEFEAGDDAGTRIYVATRTAEVVLATTRAQRAAAWIGTIPHWLYFSALRQNQPLWFRLVVGLSAAACLLAVLGLVMTFTQWRPTRPLDLRRSIPYRGGMRWHYISGALFGFFVLTWAFSGLLSMEPFQWTSKPELQVPPEALSGGPPQLGQYDLSALHALPAIAAPRVVKEVTFRRIHGGHFLSLRTPEGAETLVDATTLAARQTDFSTADILRRLQAALPDVSIGNHALLSAYDDYYYSRSRQLPLPVLRVKLDDPLRTWLYVDPARSQLLANVHRYSRVERWLYNGLHSLDFRFWHSRRPLWDLVMITLLLGGLTTSSLGFYYGMRRLFARRPAAS